MPLWCLVLGSHQKRAAVPFRWKAPSRTLVVITATEANPDSERRTMEGGYAVWMGQPVILRVVAGNIRVPVRGRLVSETNNVLRLRVADNWDIDIFKSMVVAVEHDVPVALMN